jgi:pyruvate dehydrogenase E1 component
VDARFITLTTLSALAREGQLPTHVVQQAMRDLDINPEKIDPMMA